MTRPPAALVRVVEGWQAHGRPRQPAILWRRERWRATQALGSLPEYLDRATVHQACLDAPSSPAAARRAFLVVMAWGHGKVATALAHHSHPAESSRAPDRLTKVAQHLGNRGALDAYDLLGGGCRLQGLGPAFAPSTCTSARIAWPARRR